MKKAENWSEGGEKQSENMKQIVCEQRQKRKDN